MMFVKTLLVAGVAAATAFVATPAAYAASPSPQPTSDSARVLGGCGQIRNVTTSGARAHWELSCDSGLITVSGWLQDTDADGQCAKVKAVFASGTTEFSSPACPDGVKKHFSWSHPGAIADVYLYEYDV
ncbi:hypothetical protein [Streptosporangium longisporum]|uniref:Secreted protein n=1 Tax=Streptosporangium longisporum TaxID=46187 RepID=A0ABP6LAL2_9ACTN